MKVQRLFEIIYILMNKENVTASSLADKFEVSTRTIYRDIEVLSGAGIPVYATKGRGGGIGLLPEFILNKSLLTEQEQNEILFALQSLDAIGSDSGQKVLSHLNDLFHKDGINWIDVDFSHWDSGEEEKQKFGILKHAILNHYIITFLYHGSYGITTSRSIEPIKLVFKSSSWYLQGYCLEKQSIRTFKVQRMEDLIQTDTNFQVRKIEVPEIVSTNMDKGEFICLKLEFSPSVAYRVYDEFDYKCISKQEDGSMIVQVSFPEDNWVYTFLQSYGEFVTVISPPRIKNILKEKAQLVYNKYRED